MKNCNAVSSKSGRGHLHCVRDVVVYERFQLTGKNLVFWIDGRLWEGVAYKRWSHMEARLYM